MPKHKQLKNQTLLIHQSYLFSGYKTSFNLKLTTTNYGESKEDRVFVFFLQLCGTIELKAKMTFEDNPDYISW